MRTGAKIASYLAALLAAIFVTHYFEKGCAESSIEASQAIIDSLSRENAFLSGQNSSLLNERPLLLSLRDSFAGLIVSEIRGLRITERSYKAPKITPVVDSSEAVKYLKQVAGGVQ